MKIPAILACLLLFSCNKYVSRTIYTNPERVYYENKKVLVIGISPGNAKMERKIEESLIRLLSKSGFDAVSYVDASEMFSMAIVSQDAVGFILEQNNVDYVLTVANIDKSRAIPARQPGDLANLSYFKHVLTYQPDRISPGKKGRNNVWETILFDVHSFDASLIIQTGRRTEKENKEIYGVTNRVANHIIRAIQPGQQQRKGF